MNALGVLGCSGNHNYFCHFVNAASLPRNRLHLRTLKLSWIGSNVRYWECRLQTEEKLGSQWRLVI